jgi:hypothetical protein
MVVSFAFSRHFRLLRVAIVLALAFWIVAGRHDAAAFAECVENDICEASAGENCSNCPNDCSCECGDDYCYTDSGPNQESCQSCPEDCYDLCVCGDNYCDWPAEGGYGSYPQCSSSPISECETCGADCPDCHDWNDCWDTNFCDDGFCAECQNPVDCWDYEIGWCFPNEAMCDSGQCVCTI